MRFYFRSEFIIALQSISFTYFSELSLIFTEMTCQFRIRHWMNEWTCCWSWSEQLRNEMVEFYSFEGVATLDEKFATRFQLWYLMENAELCQPVIRASSGFLFARFAVHMFPFRFSSRRLFRFLFSCGNFFFFSHRMVGGGFFYCVDCVADWIMENRNIRTLWPRWRCEFAAYLLARLNALFVNLLLQCQNALAVKGTVKLFYFRCRRSRCSRCRCNVCAMGKKQRCRMWLDVWKRYH